jgi:hypothetical protein
MRDTVSTAHALRVWKLRLELAWLDVQLSWVRFQLFVFS